MAVRWQLIFHIVWTTKDREALIVPDIEPDLCNMLAAKADELRGTIRAANTMPDHVHIVASIPPTISPDEFVEALKSYTSQTISREHGIALEWQLGYGIRSLDKTDLKETLAYVENQKQHHRAGTTVWALEHTSDEDEDSFTSNPN